MLKKALKGMISFETLKTFCDMEFLYEDLKPEHRFKMIHILGNDKNEVDEDSEQEIEKDDYHEEPDLVFNRAGNMYNCYKGTQLTYFTRDEPQAQV